MKKQYPIMCFVSLLIMVVLFPDMFLNRKLNNLFITAALLVAGEVIGCIIANKKGKPHIASAGLVIPLALMFLTSLIHVVFDRGDWLYKLSFLAYDCLCLFIALILNISVFAERYMTYLNKKRKNTDNGISDIKSNNKQDKTA